MSASPQGSTENQGSNVYRGASLDEVLPRIKAELGPDAIILSEREGIVGGIGGFFAKKCVEVEAASRAVADVGGSGPALPRVPAHVATSAYTGAPARSTPAAGSQRELTLADLLAGERDPAFADLLAQAGPPAQGLPPVPEELVPEEFVPMVAPPAPVGRVDVIEHEPVEYDF